MEDWTSYVCETLYGEDACDGGGGDDDDDDDGPQWGRGRGWGNGNN